MLIPGWLFCAVMGPVVAAALAAGARQMSRGELGQRGGVLRRAEDPLWFWLYGGTILACGFVVAGCVVWIGIESWRGRM